METPHNPTPAAARSIPKRVIALVALTMALLASMSATALPEAQANAPHINVEVSASGDLSIAILEPYVGVQILQNVGDGYAIWVTVKDAADPSQVVETHNAFGVTGDVIVTAAAYSRVDIGAEGFPVTLPGDLRFRESADSSQTQLKVNLTNASVAGTVLSNNPSGSLQTWNNVTVGDDVVFRGDGTLNLVMNSVDIAERFRIAKRNATMSAEVFDVNAGTTTIVADGVGDKIQIDESEVGSTRIRVKNDDAHVRVIDSEIDGGLNIRTRDGDDEVRLVGVDARRITVATGNGDDLVTAYEIDGEDLASSKITGNGGHDIIDLDDTVVDPIKVRLFEAVLGL